MKLTCWEIVEYVVKITGVPRADIMSQSRHRPNVEARHLAMYLCRRYGRWGVSQPSYPILAKYFNRKDHSTVIHAVQKMEKEHHALSDIFRVLYYDLGSGECSSEAERYG